MNEQVEQYLTAIDRLGLRLVQAIDTHTHADHITALGELRERTDCVTVMGQYSKAECVSAKVKEGEILRVDGLTLGTLFTPGHTDESFSLILDPAAPKAVFTGDVLLIRSTGRTDFQNEDPHRSWDSRMAGARLQGLDALNHPRREAPQSPYRRQDRTGICADHGVTEPAGSRDDGRRDTRQHRLRPSEFAAGKKLNAVTQIRIFSHSPNHEYGVAPRIPRSRAPTLPAARSPSRVAGAATVRPARGSHPSGWAETQRP